MKNLSIGAVIVAIMSLAQPVNAAPDYGANDAGAQLERTREQLERQRIADQIAEDQRSRGAEVEKEDENSLQRN